MVFIFGAQEEYDELGYVLLDCHQCRSQALFSIHQNKQRFTVFFIPTFNITQRHVLRCENCGSAFELKKGVLQDYVASHILNETQARNYLIAERERFKENETKQIIAEYEKFRTQKMVENTPLQEREYIDIKMLCQYCQKPIGSQMQFCPACGKKIKR
jgi:predicted amidophosphoribosyltransferase